MPSAVLKEIIDIGHDITSTKYYGVAAATILFYDYLLTLSDEVKFAWNGRKSWVFVIFLANRYLPMGYQFWALGVSYGPTFSQRVCDKTAFLSALAFAVSTLLAQVVLTLRIHAITGKNRTITACFCVVITAQCALGIYSMIFVAMRGAQQIPPIPLDAYRVCAFVRHRSVEIGIITIGLVYDLMAFLLVVYLVSRSNVQRLAIPSLLRIIARDATYYFLVIFTSHLVLELTISLARPSLQLLPGIGNLVYLPVMISRLMLSLRKAAAASLEHSWSLGEPTTNTVKFPDRRSPVTTRDEISLAVFSSKGKAA